MKGDKLLYSSALPEYMAIRNSESYSPHPLNSGVNGKEKGRMTNLLLQGNCRSDRFLSIKHDTLPRRIKHIEKSYGLVNSVGWDRKFWVVRVCDSPLDGCVDDVWLELARQERKRLGWFGLPY